MTAVFELQTVDRVPEELRRLVPSLAERQALKVGDLARLYVLMNGRDLIAPWVTVTRVTASGYVGEVGGVLNSAEWKPYGALIEFTADNVIGV